jgi:hypothetical protein
MICRPLPLAPIFETLASELMLWESSPNYMFAADAALSIALAIARDHPGRLKYIEPIYGRIQPLLTAPSFLFFRSAFFPFVMTLINFDPAFSLTFMELALRFWPHRATSKQVCLFRLFAVAIPTLAERHSSALLPRLLGALASAIESSSARVAEAALAFLLDRGLDFFISANARAVIAALFPAIQRASETHWSADARELAGRASAKLTKCDPRCCAEVSAPTAIRPDSRAMQVWVKVAEAAARNGHHLGMKLGQIARAFGGAGRMPEIMSAASAGKVGLRRAASPALQLPLARRVSNGA